MHRISLILLLILGALDICAQSVTVSSFELDENDPTANMPGTMVLDGDGEKCSLIKIQTIKTGFSFDVGTLGVKGTRQKVGEIWVYVPEGVKTINLSHPIYWPCNYTFPETLQKGRTYIMKLAIAENFHTQQLNISYTPAHAIILLDGQLVEASNGKISMDVLHGVHEFLAVASGYAPQSGSITLDQKYAYNLNITLKPNTRELAVIDKFKPVKVLEEKDYSEAEEASLLQPRRFNVTGSNVSAEFTMIPVDAGTFMMGGTSEQVDPNDDETPLHQVNLDGYYIGETEVTQELWQAVMGINPSRHPGDQRPVEYVNWTACQTFVARLNELTGEKFRLPTEAEWEFAARGGNKTNNTQYAGSATIHDVAWDADNSGDDTQYANDRNTHDVKKKEPNELGIYDMSGNVAEWCQDWKGAYTSTPQVNPTGPMSGLRRIVRGGSWNSYSAGECRTAARSSNLPEAQNDYIGLRLALDL